MAAETRLLRTLALDPEAYKEIADDGRATVAAVGVVVAATILAGLGGLFWTQWGGRWPANAIFETDIPHFVSRSVIAGGLIQVVMWLVWVGLTGLYLRAFGEAVDWGRLVRVMGFAAAPLGLQIALAPRGLEIAVGALAFGLTGAAMITAVRAATGAAAGRVTLSVLAGFALFAITLSLLGSGNRDLAPGLFAIEPLWQSVANRPVP